MTHWDRTKKIEINGNLKKHISKLSTSVKKLRERGMSKTTSVTSIGLIKINISVYDNHGTFYKTARVLIHNTYIRNLLVSSHTTSSAGCSRFFSSLSVVWIIAQ